MSDPSADFCLELVRLFPALQPVLEEHYDWREPEERERNPTPLADNDKELLPHLFFGDVSRYIEGLLADKADADLRPLFAFFESEFADGDEHTRELLAVSLLENLWDKPEVSKYLGPEMRKQFQVIRGAS